MTSVQNRLQPLSGSKILALAFCCWLSSCTTTKTGTGSKENIPLPQNKEGISKQATKEGPVTIPDKKPYKKTSYTIAMLLPFGSSKAYISNLDEPGGYNFPEESQLAAEYYQGALMALDSLQQLGLNVKLLVHDVGLDTIQLKKNLMAPDLISADLIIGPVGNSNLKIACDFSLSHKIWLVSPFSVMVNGHSPNPNYVLANATLRSHCEKIYDYISRKNYNSKVYLIYKKRPADLELVNYFKEYQSSDQSPNNHAIQFVELTDSSKIKFNQVKDALSDSGRNIIIVPSNDEIFVRFVLRQLNGLTDAFLMEVYGMPTWVNFDLIPREQFVNVSTHITQNFWIDKSGAAAEKFKNAYVEKFKVNPTDYAVKGYDQLLYFGNILIKQGIDFETAFKQSETTELAERFSLQPVLSNSDQSFLYYENKSVFMLQYETDKLRKLTY
ncbi:MAG: ABC transporter substrate-binding protein [Chitinophagales bacterium]